MLSSPDPGHCPFSVNHDNGVPLFCAISESNTTFLKVEASLHSCSDAELRHSFTTSIIIPRLLVSLPCSRPVPGGRLPVNRAVADSPNSKSRSQLWGSLIEIRPIRIPVPKRTPLMAAQRGIEFVSNHLLDGLCARLDKRLLLHRLRKR